MQRITLRLIIIHITEWSCTLTRIIHIFIVHQDLNIQYTYITDARSSASTALVRKLSRLITEQEKESSVFNKSHRKYQQGTKM